MGQSIQSKINQNNNLLNSINDEIDAASTKNDILRARIASLETARKAIERARNEAAQLAIEISNIEPGEWWGSRWDEFSQKVHDHPALSEAVAFVNSLKGLEEAIKKEERELESRINYVADFIKGLKNQLSDAQQFGESLLRELNKATN